MQNIKFHFQLLTRRLKFNLSTIELLTSSWKIKISSSYYFENENKKLSLWVTNWLVKLSCSTFELLTQIWKSLLRIANSKNEKNKIFIWINRDLIFLEMKYYTIRNYLERIKASWNFLLKDMDFGLNSCCLWSSDFSTHALRYCVSWKMIL